MKGNFDMHWLSKIVLNYYLGIYYQMQYSLYSITNETPPMWYIVGPKAR